MRRPSAQEDPSDEDSALVARIVANPGDPEACRRLLEKYWRLVIAWVHPRLQNSSEAEDVAQETFIRAFQAMGLLKDPRRFLGWLLKIARNRATDHARRRHGVQSLDRLAEEGGFRDPPARPDDPGERIDRGEEYGKVLEAVDRLADRYRLVIMLRYFEGLSGSEIARILGEPEGTIRNRLFRAHEKIRSLLGTPFPAAPRGIGTHGIGSD